MKDMETDFKKYSVESFLSLLASDAHAPGGGTVAAVNLALGAAMVEMVTALTIGRKRYVEVEEEMLQLQAKASDLRLQAEQLMQSDSDAYMAVRAAYALSRETEDDKAIRRIAIIEATRGAIKVPMTTAEFSLLLFDYAAEALLKGNINAGSDALVAGHQAQAACLGGLANVRINLSSLDDELEIASLEEQIASIEKCLKSKMDHLLVIAKAQLD
jgi:formiminotetrahydrofolate cyclodeaminase